MTPAPASPHVSVDLAMVADNPLMRAAASLLLALGRLRASLSRAGAGPLMDQVAQAIEEFERDAAAAGAPAEQVQVAKYALAATADDIVQNLASEDRHVWTRYSMLVRFFGERTGGVKFFQELDRAKQNPAVNLSLLELMHACLSLGFEGVYRAAGGMGALQGLRRDLYETIRRARPKTNEDLSPHWRGQTIGLAGSRLQIPVWAVAAAAGVLLLAVYLFLRHLLNGEAEALAAKMAALYPDGELQLAREVAVKPPPAPKTGSRAAARLHQARARAGDHGRQGERRADAVDDLRARRQRGAVPLRRRQRQRLVRADRQEDRARARQAAGRDHRHRLHRRRPHPHARLSLQFRAVAGAREIGGRLAEARPRRPEAPAGAGQGRRPIRSRRTTSRPTSRRTGASNSRSRATTARDAEAMTWAFWLWVALSVLGALLLAALVWFGGPLISVADYAPLEGAGVRLTIIFVVFLIVGGVIAWRIVKRRRAAAALAQAMTEAAQEDSDAPVLKQKMEDALATLRNSKSGGAALYDLPWYLIIGPPGAGKTTALVNSGLRFPLAVGGGPKAVQGIGGTRYCDWWFTDQAVLIDTAGRYTTQDSDAKADRRSWLAFLDLLRHNRPRQPINGVLVAISIADLLTLSASEIAAHADAIRRRLDELHEQLRINFPVYAVFTKMDLIAGFTPYFADLDEAGRNVVWGATFQTANKTANTVAQVGEEFDLLVKRIFERMPERLQDEPDPRARATLFGMPAQLTAIRKPIVEFLNRMFEPTRYQTTAALRGFYFTSGTQEGTPLDAVIGALQRSYGVESFGAAAHSGLGKSYFLHDLMTKVIFGEAGWVSVNIAAVRRALVARGAAFAAIALATAGVLALWWVSFRRQHRGHQGDRNRLRQLRRRRLAAHQADHGQRSRRASGLRADRRVASPALRLRQPRQGDAAQPDVRPERARPRAGRLGHRLSDGAGAADAAAPDPFARAADSAQRQRPHLYLRGAEGLSDARRQGAVRRQGARRSTGSRTNGRSGCSPARPTRRAARCCARICRRCSTWTRARRRRFRSTAPWSSRRRRRWRGCRSRSAPMRC